MPKNNVAADGVAKAPPAPPGGRRSRLRLDAQTERFAAEAESKGQRVFRGVTLSLSDFNAGFFTPDICIGVVVPRSATVRDFIQQAVRNIRKTLEKKEVKYSEDSLQNLQFFVGPDNMCPHHDLSMLELERRFKGDDEVVRMKFGTTN